MSYTIEKDFAFSASHQLHGLPKGHQCGRLHGHNYVIRVRLASPLLDSHGFVMDYGNLAPFKRWLDDTLDHRHLNEVLPELDNPTAELLAYHLTEVVREVCRVREDVDIAVGVSETPKTWAWFSE